MCVCVCVCVCVCIYRYIYIYIYVYIYLSPRLFFRGIAEHPHIYQNMRFDSTLGLPTELLRILFKRPKCKGSRRAVP